MTEIAPPMQAIGTASAARRYYVLALLTAVYALNFLDRTIFNVLIVPIKAEFQLSDTAMGLLAGFGFVLLYTVLGIPVAWIADRTNRRNIIALAVAFWGAMTCLCGMAQNVTALALARIGVGVGESASNPASLSLLSDVFNKNERPRAFGIYATGVTFGIFLGFFIGGWVNQHYGWRAAMICAGLPGVLIAPLLWLTVNEPKRGASDPTGAPQKQEPFGATLTFLLTQKSYVITLLGLWLTTFTVNCVTAWTPAFLTRVHHLSSAEIGTYGGLISGFCGMAGTLAGGFIVARLGESDDRWKLWAPAISAGLVGPAFALCMLAPSFNVMLFAFAVTSFLNNFLLGPIFAIVQTLVRPTMRALAAAILLSSATCFGQGLGPLIIGMLNDALSGDYGPAAVRYSLLTASLTSMLGALLFAWAARFVRADVARVS